MAHVTLSETFMAHRLNSSLLYGLLPALEVHPHFPPAWPTPAHPSGLSLNVLSSGKPALTSHCAHRLTVLSRCALQDILLS